MNFLKAVVVSTVLSLTSNLAIAQDFSERQIKNMQKAYNFGKSNNKQVFKGTNLNIGYIMAAIIWQESSCGTNIKNGHAVGAFQNYVPTVKSRMKQEGVTKSSSQISKELSNFNTSAHWANVELKYWLNKHNGNMHNALASYNAGHNINAGKRYSSSIIQKATYLQKNDVLKVNK